MAVPRNGFTIKPADSPSSQITVAPSLLLDDTKLMVYVRQDQTEFGEYDDVAAVWLTRAEAEELVNSIKAVLDNA